MAKKLIVHNEEIVNNETGEITTVRKSVSITTKNSDEFFMIYVRFVSGLFELSSANDIKILIRFCQLAEFNTGAVLIPAGRRKEMLDEFGMQSSHFSNAIARLKKANLLTGEQGNYKLNPIVVWKGDIKTRDQLIRNKGLDFNVKFTSEEFN